MSNHELCLRLLIQHGTFDFPNRAMLELNQRLFCLRRLLGIPGYNPMTVYLAVISYKDAVETLRVDLALSPVSVGVLYHLRVKCPQSPLLMFAGRAIQRHQ